MNTITTLTTAAFGFGLFALPMINEAGALLGSLTVLAQ